MFSLPLLTAWLLSTYPLTVHASTCPTKPVLPPWLSSPWTESAEILENRPWTYEPECVGPSWKHAEFKDVRFCVFTTAHFHEGRGLAVITTPDAADSIFLSTGFMAPESRPRLPDVPAWEEKNLPGRGMALVANRTIKTGEIILMDQPVLIVVREAYRLLTEVDQEMLQWKALLRLPEAGRKAARGLAKAGLGDEIMDVMQTNGFAQAYGGVGHVHLVPQGARINHDCRPNAYYRYDEDMMTHVVWALRDIEAGEEITHSYIHDPDVPSQKRKQVLRDTWAFECNCSICGASKNKVEESDQRLEIIRRQKDRLFISAGEQKKPNMTASIEELLQLYDDEGLIFPKIELFELGAYAYGQMGKEEMAMKYAHRAKQWWNWAVGSSVFVD
ncbi:SET domain-containing protein [Microthyrium microscopicum]|uniref:SET domain-containing protein n=1 Tax=Microthyrium microscopicum TaxID=703497 RepID=A0A6A6ULR4_9PEZI|nr:SET domain-containing protein [Microthyrium microscopicum]